MGMGRNIFAMMLYERKTIEGMYPNIVGSSRRCGDCLLSKLVKVLNFGLCMGSILK
jgi:hypothetical protein